MLSLPAAISRKKPITISCSSSFCPSTSECTSTLVRSSVGLSWRAAISLRQCSKISGTSFSIAALEAAGVQVRVGRAERRVHQPRPHRVVLLGDAHEAADHARDDRLRDVADEVARLTAVEAVEHVDRDRPDRVLVRGDPPGREARLEQRLQAVVLGRIHADEHRLRELEREAARGRHDATAFPRSTSPVAADGVDVLGGGHRPEAGLLGELFEALGPVDRALAAHLLEQLVRRTVPPELAAQ